MSADPERLAMSAGGRLGASLNELCQREPDAARLEKIARGLAAHGVVLAPLPVEAPAQQPVPGGWSLLGKIVVGLAALALVGSLAALAARGPEARSEKLADPRSPDGRAAPAQDVVSKQEPQAARASAPGSPATPPIQAAEADADVLPPAADAPALAPNQTDREVEPGERQAVVAAAAAPDREVPSNASTAGAGRTTRSSTTSADRAVTSAPSSPSSADTQSSEIALLQEARASLASSPAAALNLTAQHRELYPRGKLVQERELIAITALKKLGRGDEASRRADHFRRTYPRSAYLKQIDRVVGKD
jgi:hypothetical protein